MHGRGRTVTDRLLSKSYLYNNKQVFEINNEWLWETYWSTLFAFFSSIFLQRLGRALISKCLSSKIARRTSSPGPWWNKRQPWVLKRGFDYPRKTPLTVVRVADTIHATSTVHMHCTTLDLDTTPYLWFIAISIIMILTIHRIQPVSRLVQPMPPQLRPRKLHNQSQPMPHGLSQASRLGFLTARAPVRN